MNVVVLLAGVADPRWPLAAVSTDFLGDRARNHICLSPFDEAALEIALKIREGRSGTRVTVAMTGGVESDPLLRKVAAYRPDRAVRIDGATLAFHDAHTLAATLAAMVPQLDAAVDMVLIGREFGDCDSGTVPPCLAATLGWTFFGLAQHAQWQDGRLWLVREQGSIEESVPMIGQWVVSVTNDRRNRLRHPLMKNVIEARRMSLATLVPSPQGKARLALDAVAAAPERARDVPCRMLSGSFDVQVGELAAFLAPWKARA
jgi:electron transfer flavoprotein beta subunit